VRFTAVDETTLSQDIVPLKQLDAQSCRNDRALEISPTQNEATIQVDWKVWGGLRVDQTELWYANWDDGPVSKLDCSSQPSMESIQSLFQRGTMLGLSTGTTEFSKAIESTTFSAMVDVSSFLPGDEIVIIASARVDQVWAQEPDSIAPQVLPQSHIANVRTNPNWYHESERNIIQGRLDWFSQPFTVVIGEKAEPLTEPTMSPSGMESNEPTTFMRGSLGPSQSGTWRDTGVPTVSPTTLSPSSLGPSLEGTFRETDSPTTLSPSSLRPSCVPTVSPITLSSSSLGPSLEVTFRKIAEYWRGRQPDKVASKQFRTNRRWYFSRD
jgi:hypothetical protein